MTHEEIAQAFRVLAATVKAAKNDPTAEKVDRYGVEEVLNLEQKAADLQAHSEKLKAAHEFDELNKKHSLAYEERAISERVHIEQHRAHIERINSDRMAQVRVAQQQEFDNVQQHRVNMEKITAAGYVGIAEAIKTLALAFTPQVYIGSSDGADRVTLAPPSDQQATGDKQQ